MKRPAKLMPVSLHRQEMARLSGQIYALKIEADAYRRCCRDMSNIVKDLMGIKRED